MIEPHPTREQIVYRFAYDAYECPYCGKLWYYEEDAYDCRDRCCGDNITRKPIQESNRYRENNR